MTAERQALTGQGLVQGSTDTGRTPRKAFLGWAVMVFIREADLRWLWLYALGLKFLVVSTILHNQVQGLKNPAQEVCDLGRGS